MTSIVFACLFCLLAVNTEQSCERLKMSLTRISQFDDKKITQSLMWTVNLEKGQCIMKCFLNSYCVSVQFVPATSTCIGFWQHFSGKTVSSQDSPGYQLYETSKDPYTCGPPPSKPNADVTYISDEPGSVATYSCETYYRSEGGVLESTCQLGGWQDVDPNCQRWMWYPSMGDISLSAFRGLDFHIQVKLSAINSEMINVAVAASKNVDNLFYLSVRWWNTIAVNSYINGGYGAETRIPFNYAQDVPFVIDIEYAVGTYKLRSNGQDLISFPERTSQKPYYFKVGNGNVEYVEKY